MDIREKIPVQDTLEVPPWLFSSKRELADNMAEDEERKPLLRDAPDGAGPELSQSGSINAHVSVVHEVRPLPKITNNQAMMHLMKGMIGTGILAIPSAIRNSGLWVGFIGLLIFGIICVHCMHLLVKCSHGLSKRLNIEYLEYSGVVREGFRTSTPFWARLTTPAVISVNIFLCLTQYGFCCVYILFIGQNVHQVIEKTAGFTALPEQFYQAMATVLLLIIMFIKELKNLAAVSMFANILCFTGLVIILQYCVRGLAPITSFPAFSSWAQLPLYFGTAVYAFEGIGVVLPLAKRMHTPDDFRGQTGVLNTGMVIVTCLYTATGFYGYMKTGGIKGSITLDLPDDDWLYLSVRLMFALAIFCTYPLQFFVSHHIVWPKFRSFLTRFSCTANPTYLHEYLFKVVVVLLTFLLAAVIPHLDLMISLIGALASTAIALIFPALLDLVIFYPTRELAVWEVIKDVLLLIFAFIGFVAGTGTAIYNIIQKF